jgi:hypothetical protein
MMHDQIFPLLSLLFIKHLLVDFFWQQDAYEYEGKGHLNHPGGYIHALKHCFTTLLCFMLTVPQHLASFAVFLVGMEFVIHYLTDYTKVNVCKAKGWGPTTHSQFWLATGTDQFVHAATYIGMVWLLCLAGQ